MNTPNTTPAQPVRYLAFNVAYQIAPETRSRDLLEEATCFLESAAGLLNDAAANAGSPNEQSSLYGIWHLLNLSKDMISMALAKDYAMQQPPPAN